MYDKATDFQVVLKAKELENKYPFSKDFPSLLLGRLEGGTQFGNPASRVFSGETWSHIFQFELKSCSPPPTG